MNYTTTQIPVEKNTVNSSVYDGVCHIECSKEQNVLVQCMDQLNNNPAGGNGTEGALNTDRRCLEPAISSWISCCHAANERQASLLESNP